MSVIITNENEKILNMLIDKEIGFILSYGVKTGMNNVIPNGIYKLSMFKTREYDNKECAIFKNDVDGKPISIPINKLLNAFTETVFMANYMLLGLGGKYSTVEDVVSHLSDMVRDGKVDIKTLEVGSYTGIFDSCCALMDSLNSLNAHYETNDDKQKLGDNYSVVPVAFGNIIKKVKIYSDGNTPEKYHQYYTNNFYSDYGNTINNKENKNCKRLKI